MEKEQASGKGIDKEKIYHALSVTILLASLLLSVFYFRPVFWRVLESFKDFGLSVGVLFHGAFRLRGRDYADGGTDPPTARRRSYPSSLRNFNRD